MFAVALYFHPHYLHAEFYARSEGKTEHVLRAHKNPKLKVELVTISMNLAKAKMFYTLPCCKVHSVLIVVKRGEGEKLCNHKEGKVTLVVCEVPTSCTPCRLFSPFRLNVGPGVNSAHTSVHENVQIITHQQSQGRQMEQSLP